MFTSSYDCFTFQYFNNKRFANLTEVEGQIGPRLGATRRMFSSLHHPDPRNSKRSAAFPHRQFRTDIRAMIRRPAPVAFHAPATLFARQCLGPDRRRTARGAAGSFGNRYVARVLRGLARLMQDITAIGTPFPRTNGR